ncbi:MAG: DUF1569 domain-containing protein [Longimicrobiales bacterium]
MMRTVFRPGCTTELLERLGRLRPDSARRWGRMNAHQAVCHLSDSLKALLGDRPVPARPLTLRKRLIRFVAFTVPLPWPHGFRTSTELDAEKGGTRPDVFERDLTQLESLLRRFVATGGDGLEPHYVWGRLSRGEWGRYVYRHVAHHLRQFGV